MPPNPIEAGAQLPLDRLPQRVDKTQAGHLGRDDRRCPAEQVGDLAVRIRDSVNCLRPPTVAAQLQQSRVEAWQHLVVQQATGTAVQDLTFSQSLALYDHQAA